MRRNAIFAATLSLVALSSCGRQSGPLVPLGFAGTYAVSSPQAQLNLQMDPDSTWTLSGSFGEVTRCLNGRDTVESVLARLSGTAFSGSGSIYVSNNAQVVTGDSLFITEQIVGSIPPTHNAASLWFSYSIIDQRAGACGLGNGAKQLTVGLARSR